MCKECEMIKEVAKNLGIETKCLCIKCQAILDLENYGYLSPSVSPNGSSETSGTDL